VVVLNFMYTTCQGGCVPSTENLKLVFDQLGSRIGKDVFFYSISLDATNDTPAALREYMELHEVRPGWVFLTGQKDDLERVRRSVGFVDIDPKVDAKKTEHAGLVLVGNETLDRWIKCPALGRPADLLEAISWMKPDYIEEHGQTKL
jgi:protein SCO1/2